MWYISAALKVKGLFRKTKQIKKHLKSWTFSEYWLTHANEIHYASQRQMDTHIEAVHLISQLDHNEMSENPHLSHLMVPSPVVQRLRLLAVSSEVWDGVNFPSPFITQPLCNSTRGDYSTAVPHTVDPLQCKKENSAAVRLVIGRILVVHPKCNRRQINIRVSDHNWLWPQPQWNGKYFLLDSLELPSSFYTTAFYNLSCTVAGREFTLGTIRLYYFFTPKQLKKGSFNRISLH